jgi:hypothetical protein
MITEIKMRNKVYEIKKGDYVQYNGKCYLFCSGDNRVLLYEKHSRLTFIYLTKKVVKELDLKLSQELKKGEIAKWYF